jgi:hypothetical protein
MPHRNDSVDADVRVCVRTFDHLIGELAQRYGAASVAAAFTDRTDR